MEFEQKKAASQQEKEAACEMVGFQDYFALFAACMNRLEEAADVHGAAALQVNIVRNLRVMSVCPCHRIGMPTNFRDGLADAPVFKRFRLLIPFLADAAGSLHAVAFLELLLGRMLSSQVGGQRAGSVKAQSCSGRYRS